MKPALITFAKAPAPGRVKTRLTGLLTDEEAADLYEAFLRDTLAEKAALAEKHGAALRLYHAGPRWPDALTPEGATVHRQQPGEGLGARMAAAFRETLSDDETGSVLITGTDHPTLPPAFIEQGIAALQQSREAVCIGPTEDGGFYLLGMRCFIPQLFRGMAYSHAGVFSETLTRIGRVGKRPVVLPEWYDVDRPADLRRLADDLFFSSESNAPRASHTRRHLQVLLERYPGALRSSATQEG